MARSRNAGRRGNPARRARAALRFALGGAPGPVFAPRSASGAGSMRPRICPTPRLSAVPAAPIGSLSRPPAGRIHPPSAPPVPTAMCRYIGWRRCSAMSRRGFANCAAASDRLHMDRGGVRGGAAQPGPGHPGPDAHNGVARMPELPPARPTTKQRQLRSAQPRHQRAVEDKEIVIDRRQRIARAWPDGWEVAFDAPPR